MDLVKRQYKRLKRHHEYQDSTLKSQPALTILSRALLDEIPQPDFINYDSSLSFLNANPNPNTMTHHMMSHNDQIEEFIFINHYLDKNLILTALPQNISRNCSSLDCVQRQLFKDKAPKINLISYAVPVKIILPKIEESIKIIHTPTRTNDLTQNHSTSNTLYGISLKSLQSNDYSREEAQAIFEAELLTNDSFQLNDLTNTLIEAGGLTDDFYTTLSSSNRLDKSKRLLNHTKLELPILKFVDQNKDKVDLYNRELSIPSNLPSLSHRAHLITKNFSTSLLSQSSITSKYYIPEPLLNEMLPLPFYYSLEYPQVIEDLRSILGLQVINSSPFTQDVYLSWNFLKHLFVICNSIPSDTLVNNNLKESYFRDQIQKALDFGDQVIECQVKTQPEIDLMINQVKFIFTSIPTSNALTTALTSLDPENNITTLTNHIDIQVKIDGRVILDHDEEVDAIVPAPDIILNSIDSSLSLLATDGVSKNTDTGFSAPSIGRSKFIAADSISTFLELKGLKMNIDRIEPDSDICKIEYNLDADMKLKIDSNKINDDIGLKIDLNKTGADQRLTIDSNKIDDSIKKGVQDQHLKIMAKQSYSKHQYLANITIFQRHNLLSSLQTLNIDLIERELKSEEIIIDPNTIILLLPFASLQPLSPTLAKSSITPEFISSDLCKRLAASALHFRTIHLILEEVAPACELGRLSVYPFTPPIQASLIQIYLFNHSILVPGFKSCVRIWFSNDTSETAALIRRCGDIVEGFCSCTWAFRDWISEFATAHEIYLARVPGCNHFIAQLMLQKYTIREIAGLGLDELIDEFQDWVDPSRLKIIHQIVHFQHEQ